MACLFQLLSIPISVSRNPPWRALCVVGDCLRPETNATGTTTVPVRWELNPIVRQGNTWNMYLNWCNATIWGTADLSLCRTREVGKLKAPEVQSYVELGSPGWVRWGIVLRFCITSTLYPATSLSLLSGIRYSWNLPFLGCPSSPPSFSDLLCALSLKQNSQFLYRVAGLVRGLIPFRSTRRWRFDCSFIHMSLTKRLCLRCDW